MADLNEVQVRTLVDETDIGQIKPDMTASIRVEAYPDRDFNGLVLKIEPQAVVEQGVTMFAVLTRIRNDDDLLRPGMNADVEMVVGNRADVLAIANGAIKTPDEARKLVNALGMDPALLEASVERDSGRRGEGGPRGESGSEVNADETEQGEDATTQTEDGDAESGDGLPTMADMQNMSREERRAMFEKLTPAQRRQVMQRAQTMRDQRAAEERANPERPKPGFVFVYDDANMLTLKPIVMGLTTWEHTEIVGGLEEGDVALKIPMSLVSQAELLARFRSFSSIPGISRD
jgi:HlyD family secretion protein